MRYIFFMPPTSPNPSDSIPQTGIPEGATPAQDPREPLTQKQIVAIQLKFAGHSYEDMAEVVGAPANTIRSWFRRGTHCYGAYWRFSKEMSHQASKEALKSLQSHLGAAVNTIHTLINDPKTPLAIQLRAAMFVVQTIAPRVDAEQAKREAMREVVARLGEMYGLDSWEKIEKLLVELEIEEDYY